MVGTRLGLLVTKVTTTVATHNPRPPRNMPSQGRLLHHPPVLVPVMVLFVVPVMVVFVIAAAVVCVMSSSSSGGRRGEPSCE